MLTKNSTALNQNIEFVNYQAKHYEELKAVMQLSYACAGAQYPCEKEMNLLIKLYPQGQWVCLVDGKLAGCTIARIVPFEKYSKAHLLDEILDLDTYESDAENGNAVYGLDVVVHPDYRTLRLGKTLVEHQVNQAFKDNYQFFLGASRVSNFEAFSDQMNLKTYVQKVIDGELRDQALTFHLGNGMKVLDVMENFNPVDTESGACGVAMAIENPNYKQELQNNRIIEMSDYLFHNSNSTLLAI